MTPPAFVFSLTCLLLAGAAGVARGGTSALRPLVLEVGEDATLPCFFEDAVTVTMIDWYKQTLGLMPEQMSHFYKRNQNGSFVGEFKKNSRLGLDTGDGVNHLKIANVQFSDSGIYYCTKSYLNVFEFVEGFLVSVNGAGWKIQTTVRPSVHPGGPVTLNCVVHAGTCDRPARVHWFKESGARPGIISSEQCRGNTTTQMHTCEYNLLVEDLSASHAGTYHCAVASCGRILFGEGATLNGKNPSILVYVLSGALGFAAILTGFLAYTVYTLRRTLKHQSSSIQPGPPEPTFPNAEDEDSLHYAALSERRVSRLRRQKDVTTECVYSSVKH